MRWNPSSLPASVSRTTVCTATSSEVTCSFTDGVLMLRGRVPSYHLKQILQEKLQGLPRVAVIRNEVGK